MMRVIAGTARGMRLKVPERVARPSTDRLREALFSILASCLPDAKVLDLFAGSGSLGIEALSRGAESAVFVDSQRAACLALNENLAKTRLVDRATCHQRDVFDALKSLSGSFDLIFADPPYARSAPEDWAGKLLGVAELPMLLNEDGLLVLEVESEREAPQGEGWELADQRIYGGCAILFYRRGGAT